MAECLWINIPKKITSKRGGRQEELKVKEFINKYFDRRSWLKKTPAPSTRVKIPKNWLKDQQENKLIKS